MPGIIRAADLKCRVVRSEVLEAQQQAATIVHHATLKAQEMLDAANRKAVAIRADAVAEGRAAGYQEVAQSLLKAHQAFDSALAEAENDLIRLAVTSSKRIVHEELKLDPGHIRAIVSDALQRVRQAKQLRVFLHPEDKRFLQTASSDPSLHLDHVSLVEDADLSRGGCVISSEWGEVDARLEVRLDLLQEALQK